MRWAPGSKRFIVLEGIVAIAAPRIARCKSPRLMLPARSSICCRSVVPAGHAEVRFSEVKRSALKQLA